MVFARNLRVPCAWPICKW